MIVLKFIKDKWLQNKVVCRKRIYEQIGKQKKKNGKARIFNPRPSGGLRQLRHSGEAYVTTHL